MDVHKKGALGIRNAPVTRTIFFVFAIDPQYAFQIFFTNPCFVVEEKAKTHSMNIAPES